MEVQTLLSFYQILIYLDNQWLPLLKDALTKWVAYTYHNIVRCPLCTRGDIAIMFCIDCDVPIDQECLEFHKSIKSYLEHNIIEIRTCKQKFQIKQFARKHTCACRKKPPAESFCNTCRCFICEKCVESHNIENHTIISLQDVYLILESIHELKLSLEENICTSPTIEDEKLVLSKTAISWIEAVFGINTDFDDVCSVPVPSCLRRALVEGKTSPKTIIMTIAQLRQQLDTVKRELCQIPDGNEMELANGNDQTHAHLVTGNTTEQSSQTRSNDSNIQPYLHQQPDEGTEISGNHDRPIDKEIIGLQQAQQHQLDLESFINLHNTS